MHDYRQGPVPGQIRIPNASHWTAQNRCCVYAGLVGIQSAKFRTINCCSRITKTFPFLQSLDELTDKAVPKNIQFKRGLQLEDPLSESSSKSVPSIATDNNVSKTWTRNHFRSLVSVHQTSGRNKSLYQRHTTVHLEIDLFDLRSSSTQTISIFYVHTSPYQLSDMWTPSEAKPH